MLASNEEEFSALRATCRAERDARTFQCANWPLERLRRALVDVDLTREERLVRLRHALRHATCGSEFGGLERSLPLPMPDRDTPERELALFGLVRRPSGEVAAQPWLPDWLTDVPTQGADHAAMQAAPRPWTHEPPVADPWVRERLGIGTYRGPGQALAVRSVLHLPAGETLVVVLPTGEGKSLVFHALAHAYQEQAVAVVVPTVPLAVDQELSLQQRDPARTRYHAYVGGNEARATAISAALRDGQQGLLFAAPEAFTASLREPLLQAARTGRLAGVVIDEAHLVEAWGTDFRSDFQSLGALVAELRAVAPPTAQPRVVCLSATLSQLALDTLEALFSPHRPMALVAATRLRPEPDLWIAPLASNVETRAERVINALRSLPRPAVLYVTQRKDAESWRERLHRRGFRRIGVVHGDTNAADREQVLQQWRTGNLDLVVGTSAFGLGIDLDSVRTIVHACVPETLDRYYQEIGRAGRDNCSAVGVLVPAASDLPVAERLSRKTVIGEEKGRGRWDALFHAAARVDGAGHRVLVDVTASPGYDPDMRSGRNEDWNINVLNLLVRAGVIRYAGIERRSRDNQLLLAIDICDQRHLDPELWETRIRPLRERMAQANRRAHEAVRTLLSSTSCPSELFAGMYRLRYREINHNVAPACGGCVVCRGQRPGGWFAQWPKAPHAPYPVGQLSPRLAQAMDAQGRLFISYGRDVLEARRFQRHLRQLVEALWRAGLRKFVIVGDAPTALHEALKQHPWCVAEGTHGRVISGSGLPPGPFAVWLGPGVSLPASQLADVATATPRLMFVPMDLGDPRYPGSALADRVHLTGLEDLLEELNQ